MKYLEKYWTLILLITFFSSFITPAIPFMIVGLLAFFFGIGGIIFQKRIINKGIQAMGMILSYESSSSGHKTPVIEFTTLTGEKITAKPFVYSSTDISKIRTYAKLINTAIPILYDPEDPNKFVIRNDGAFNYIIMSVALLAGLFFIVLSICNFLGCFKFSGQ